MSNKIENIRNNRDNITAWFAEGIPATEICDRIGVKKTSTLKANCLKLGIPWKPNPGKYPSYRSCRPSNFLGSLDAAIANGSRKEVIKKYLLLERGHRCENCELSEWMSQDIPLEIHHINGEPRDNRRENIQLICPNCHSLTPNFCSRNKNSNKNNKDEINHKYSKPKIKLGGQSKLSDQDVNNRKSIISSLNLNKYGWIMEASRILELSHSQIRRFIKSYMPDLVTRTRKKLAGSGFEPELTCF